MKKLNNKGVTMMLLVVTIIVMIIIAFLAVFYSQNVTPEARISAAYASLKSVKDSCVSAIQYTNFGDKDEYYFFGKQMTDEQKAEYAPRCGLSDASEFGDERVYLIDSTSVQEEDKRRIQNLELSNLSGIYVVDLEKDKYYLVDGTYRVEGNIKYEYYDIQAMYSLLTDTLKDE